ncbi:MAG: cytochrome C oxidase subunit IV family protein [Elusimicrobia bacterium]|nr:cytochrome C oxidase subunit IV family protein [Elusimicrobiota bacterium]MDE2511481.1 cytochrome C oxidase subunit IV family protein [Elusimicrobiota bacterium]
MSKNKNSHSAAHDDHRPNVKLYIGVFAALLALTGLTVFISTFHLPRPQAIALGLLVAAVKGTLVAAIFMHLWGENKLIFKVLLVTIAAAFMMIMPMIDFHLLSSRISEHANIAAQHPDEGAKTPGDKK